MEKLNAMPAVDILNELESMDDRYLREMLPARELAARLEKAGAVSEDGGRMEVMSDYDEIVQRLKSEGRPAFLLPNYTSMMELRQAISKVTGSREFWE